IGTRSLSIMISSRVAPSILTPPFAMTTCVGVISVFRVPALPGVGFGIACVHVGKSMTVIRAGVLLLVNVDWLSHRFPRYTRIPAGPSGKVLTDPPRDIRPRILVTYAKVATLFPPMYLAAGHSISVFSGAPTLASPITG